MEEPPKRGRGRPKKEVTEPEEPKRPRGRPKKEKTEPEEPKRPRGRPKKAGEPVKEVAGKILITETAPASPEGPSAAGGGKPIVTETAPPEKPSPAGEGKPIVTETAPEVGVIEEQSDKGWRRYRKFREGFEESEYQRWEKGAIAKALKEGRKIHFFSYGRNRYVAEFTAPSVWTVYEQDWLRAKEEGKVQDYSVKWIGYLGSGSFRDIPFPT